MKNTFVVAIGLSAGGLDPLKSFFDSTPHDSVTYVILRHISAIHQSQLHLILQKHSRLKIVEAENEMVLENDTVYIPPASMYLTIKGDRLYLHNRVQETLFPNWIVDVFFTSLAEAKGNKCIAVILSGAGSDGAKGATAIHNAGGMVIAQLPETCIQSSMPRAVIDLGIVDHILPPNGMPPVILHHVETILKNANGVQKLKSTGRKNLPA